MDEKILINELVKDINVGAIASTSIRVTKYMINKLSLNLFSRSVHFMLTIHSVSRQIKAK